MAQKRRSATQVRARERARQAAAEAVARQERLLEAAEGFFGETLGREEQREELEKKIAALRDELAALDEPAPAAAPFVRAMKNEGLQNKDIADRLELSSGEVTKYLRMSESGSPPPGASGEPAVPARSGEGSEKSTLVGGDASQ